MSAHCHQGQWIGWIAKRSVSILPRAAPPPGVCQAGRRRRRDAQRPRSGGARWRLPGVGSQCFPLRIGSAPFEQACLEQELPPKGQGCLSKLVRTLSIAAVSSKSAEASLIASLNTSKSCPQRSRTSPSHGHDSEIEQNRTRVRTQNTSITALPRASKLHSGPRTRAGQRRRAWRHGGRRLRRCGRRSAAGEDPRLSRY